jgi:hypothetical protein
LNLNGNITPIMTIMTKASSREFQSGLREFFS